MPRNHQSSKAARQQRAKAAARPKPVWLWGVLGVVVVIAIALIVFQSASHSPTEITAAQAYQKYQQGIFFLDVRTQIEWDRGHLNKSTLIPLDQLPNRLSDVPKDRDVVVICQSGLRSKNAVTLLRNAGYTHVVSMTGGLNAWQSDGYPLDGNGP
ncbi:MAG: rhodanese-like domain-containing protein [Anaerolineales bacterium]